MKLSTAVTFGLVVLPAVTAFAPMAATRSRTALGMSDSFSTANSLAAANAQKAAAIRAAEARNQAEIEALKAQIAQIESLFNRSPGGFTPTPPTLPPDVASMNQNQLQTKLGEFKDYLGTLLQRSKDNQNQLAGLGGSGTGSALATAAVAGSMGALVTNALDSNRRDSINGLIAGAAGSIASSLSGPSTRAPAAAPAVPNDPKSQFVFGRIQQAFPGAQSNADLVKKVKGALRKYGYGKDTLLATSFCCDEVNRPLDEAFAAEYGQQFNMGGLAGFPFGGVTGFAAMAKHVPDGGSCLVVYGPHVGVDFDGKVGTVNRRGKEKGGTCCGSAVAASGYVNSVYKGEIEEAKTPTATMDAQQIYVGSVLLPYAERLAKANDPMVELPYVMFEPVDDLTQKIVAKAAGKVGGNGKIALLGGIQINTPTGMSDFFLPLRFEVRDNKDTVVENLLYEKRF
uniref:Limiting CO2-inducible protein B/C beta carbonyic anhydrase domain-containing protein n=1 Tax=Amphora coffeiformis TaxID=265554 RepID=A0A7S3LCW1_9STRA|eukprot:scaffold158_cov141-Amphora_coffeaeformis.AAC.6